MDVTDLRIALFSGNYNYVRDGANQALNRLVDYLLRRGAAVRIYSPTVEQPALPPCGDLIHIPSMPFPGRPEYRVPLMIPSKVKRDIREPLIYAGILAVLLGYRWIRAELKKPVPAPAPAVPAATSKSGSATAPERT